MVAVGIHGHAGGPVRPDLPAQFRGATTFTMVRTANVAEPCCETREAGERNGESECDGAGPASLPRRSWQAGRRGARGPGSRAAAGSRGNIQFSGGKCLTKIAPVCAPIAMNAACPNERRAERQANVYRPTDEGARLNTMPTTTRSEQIRTEEPR